MFFAITSNFSSSLGLSVGELYFFLLAQWRRARVTVSCGISPSLRGGLPAPFRCNWCGGKRRHESSCWSHIISASAVNTDCTAGCRRGCVEVHRACERRFSVLLLAISSQFLAPSLRRWRALVFLGQFYVFFCHLGWWGCPRFQQRNVLQLTEFEITPLWSSMKFTFLTFAGKAPWRLEIAF